MFRNRPAHRVVLFLAVAIRSTCGGPLFANEAWNLWSRGQIPKAQRAAEQVLAEDPTDNESRHLLVLTAFVNGRYQDGLSHYALLDPDYDRIKELDRYVIDALKAVRRLDLAVTFAKKAGQSEAVVNWLVQLRERPLKISLEKTTVIRFDQNQVTRDLMPAVPIEINGREYLGHLDTGGSYIAMSPKMASELGVETSFIGKGRANAQVTDIEAGIVDRLTMGAATLENVPAVALSALQGALQKGEKIEDLVILGTRILEQFLTTWDNQKQRLIFSPRHDPGFRKEHLTKFVSTESQTLNFWMVPDHYLIAHGAIAGREAAFFVDTGLVTVDPQGRQPALTTSTSRLAKFGVKGELDKSTFMDAPGPIRLGPVELDNQGILVKPGSGGFGFAGIKLDALLAHGFLKHCVWTLDFDTRTWQLYQFREAATPSTNSKLAGRRKKAEKKPLTTENAGSLTKYVGVYKSDTLQSELTVTASGNSLRFSATGNLRGRFTLKKTGKHTFEAQKAPQKLTLKFDVRNRKAIQVSIGVGKQGPFPFKRQ